MATILVVDDSAFDREFACQVLGQDEGLKIVSVESAESALDRVAAGGIDLILTDLLMPDMDGLQLVARVRIDYPQIPVIVMTGGGTEVIAMNALTQGAASYVPKRMLSDWLLDTVRDALSAQQAERTHAKLLGCFREMHFQIVLQHDHQLIGPLVSYVQQIAEGIGLGDATDVFRLGIALREALQNAMYCERPIRFEAKMTTDEGRFVLASEDSRQPIFDSRALPEGSDPDALESTASRGFLLIRSHMDDVFLNANSSQATLVKCRHVLEDEDVNATQS